MQDKKTTHHGVNPVMAGVAGAVAGAGLAVAASTALKDEKNRQKVKQVLSNIKDHAQEYVADAEVNLKAKEEEAKKAVKKISAKKK